MSLDYSELGLPDKPEFKKAVELLYDGYIEEFTKYTSWSENRAVKIKQRARAGIKNINVKIARHILNNVKDPSDDLVVAALLRTSNDDSIKSQFNSYVNFLTDSCISQNIKEDDGELKSDVVNLWLAKSMYEFENIEYIAKNHDAKAVELAAAMFGYQMRCFKDVKGIETSFDEVFKKAACDTRDVILDSVNEKVADNEMQSVLDKLKLPF